MADNTKPGILRNLRIKRVSLVDVGANFDTNTGDGAHIMLFKAATRKDSPGIGAVHVDAPGIDAKTKKKPETKEKNVKTSMLKRILGLATESDVEKRKTEAAAIEKDLDNLEKAHDPDDTMCKCADCMSKNKRYEGDPAVIELAVSKAVSAVEKKHQEEIAKLQKANTDALAAIEVEKNARLDNEMVAVLKSFKATPFDLTKDVAKFRKMKQADPEMFDRTMEILKATDAQLATSLLFQNIGSGLEGSGDAWAQIEAKADALVEKSTSGLTREQAIEKVMLDPKNMVLVKQYRNGNKPSVQ